MSLFDSSSTDQNMEKSYHFSHPDHPLELKTFQKPYNCDGCNEPGFGKRYRCDLCDFDLHEDCMFFSPETSHHLFDNSIFKFFDQPPPPRNYCGRNNCDKCKRHCDACGKPVSGFVYHCEKKDLDLHPCCCNLKNKLKIDGTEFRLCEGVDSSCYWCGKVKVRDSVSGIRGWSYVSKCDKYHLHVYCVTEMVVDLWAEKNRIANNNKSLDLENLEIPRSSTLAKRRKNGGRGNKYWRIMKAIFKTIACILLGDPTIAVTCLVLDLVT